MAMLLWVDEAADVALDLGDPFLVFEVFAELARVAGSGAGWEELFSVPGFAEEEVEPEWLGKVQDQARRFRELHGDQLGEHARWVLGRILGNQE